MLSTQDKTRIDDTRIASVRPLMTPALLEERWPANAAHLALVEHSRQAISDVLQGRDDRLVVVVGPCSIHDHDQAVDYARRLQVQADRHARDLLVVMRVYFEKPRTTVGWKGYINDPHLDGSFAMNEGLEMARKLMLDILDLGLPVATEFLDLLSPQYISDLVAGIIAVMDGPEIGPFNIGNPGEFTMVELANLVRGRGGCGAAAAVCRGVPGWGKGNGAGRLEQITNSLGRIFSSL